MTTLTMKAPSAGIAKQIHGLLSGTTYTLNANGFIAAELEDVPFLLGVGFTPYTRMDNLTATTNPAATDDSADDYAVGSLWLNATSRSMWTCLSAAAGAAVWVPVVGDLIGHKLSANMNVTTDQAITMMDGGTKFRVTKITVLNASIDLTTAAGGVYTAASKGGSALVAAGQAYTALSNTAYAVDLTIAATPGKTVWAAGQALYLSLTTAQGAAATADIYVYGQRFAVG